MGFTNVRLKKILSLKVNWRLNRWYSHHLGKCGKLIDFAMLHHGCTVGELRQKLTGSLSFQKPIKFLKGITRKAEGKITITSEFMMDSIFLLRYLEKRRIPFHIVKKYCQGIRFKMAGKQYNSLGFRNNFGGFEIHNPYFKSSNSLKGITTIDNDASEVCTFEGFTDFLSFKTIHQNEPKDNFDFVILNSIPFFEAACTVMKKHVIVNLNLDRGNTRQNYSCQALSLSSKYHDESSLYGNHKDFNDWIICFGVL